MAFAIEYGYHGSGIISTGRYPSCYVKNARAINDRPYIMMGIQPSCRGVHCTPAHFFHKYQYFRMLIFISIQLLYTFIHLSVFMRFVITMARMIHSIS